MKELIHKITELDFTITSVNRARLHAKGEVSSAGWTDEELSNQRLGDGSLHLDFVAEPPTENAAEVILPMSASRIMFLAAEPQVITVHSKSNEMSVTLPPGGDPA